MTALAPLDITVAGVSLNTYAHFITTRNGWDLTPGQVGGNLRIPGKDGEAYLAKDYGPGRMVLQITVTGTDANGAIPAGMTETKQFRSNMDNLLRLFTYRGPSQVRREMEDGSVRINDAEVGAVIAPEYIDGATTANLTVELVFPDPIWSGDFISYEPLTGSATNGRQDNLSFFGGCTAPINDAVLVFTGPATNPRITDVGSGSSIQYFGTLAAGTNWRIKCGEFKSAVGASLGYSNSGDINGAGTSVLANTTFLPGPRFFPLTPYPIGVGDSNTTPGAPAIIITGTGMSSASKVNVYAAKKFIA